MGENEGQEAATGTEALCGGKKKEHANGHKNPIACSLIVVRVYAVLEVCIVHGHFWGMEDTF